MQMTLVLAESQRGSCHITSQVPEHLLSNISRLLTLWRQGSTLSFLIDWECKAGNHFSLFLHSPTYFPHPPTSHCGKYLLKMQLPSSSLPEIYPCNHLSLCEWKETLALAVWLVEVWGEVGRYSDGKKKVSLKQKILLMYNSISKAQIARPKLCSKLGHLWTLFFTATELKQSFELMHY